MLMELAPSGKSGGPQLSVISQSKEKDSWQNAVGSKAKLTQRKAHSAKDKALRFIGRRFTPFYAD